MDDEVSGRRRNRGPNRTTTARSQALERLKSIRKGETRPSYEIRLENPIYDTVEEDDYKTLVAKRREEFSDFIVGDDGDAAGHGYLDNGEEEDWTKAGVASFSSSEDDDEKDGDGGKSEFAKLKKKRKKNKESEIDKSKTKKVNKFEAAGKLMGKTKISSMFTSNVIKKRGDGGNNLGIDSVVEDVLAEFAVDDFDREKRRRSQSKNLGLGLGFGEKKSIVSDVSRKIENINHNYRDSSIDLGGNVEVVDDKEGLDEVQVKDDGNFDIVNSGGGNQLEDVREDKLENVIEAKVEKELKVEGEKVFALNAKIKEEKVETFNASLEWQAMNGSGGGDENVVRLEHEEKHEFVVEGDGSLPFYVLDAHEEIYGANAGTIYLFGKVSCFC